jgi:hypothetical protein
MDLVGGTLAKINVVLSHVQGEFRYNVTNFKLESYIIL